MYKGLICDVTYPPGTGDAADTAQFYVPYTMDYRVIWYYIESASGGAWLESPGASLTSRWPVRATMAAAWAIRAVEVFGEPNYIAWPTVDMQYGGEYWLIAVKPQGSDFITVWGYDTNVPQAGYLPVGDIFVVDNMHWFSERWPTATPNGIARARGGASNAVKISAPGGGGWLP